MHNFQGTSLFYKAHPHISQVILVLVNVAQIFIIVKTLGGWEKGENRRDCGRIAGSDWSFFHRRKCLFVAGSRGANRSIILFL